MPHRAMSKGRFAHPRTRRPFVRVAPRNPNGDLGFSPRMGDKGHLDRVWEVIQRVSICMLTTRGTEGLRARPLEARPDRASGVIWFLTDLLSAKGDEIAVEHDVGLVFIDTHED